MTAYDRRMRTLHRHHQRRAAADAQSLDYDAEGLAARVAAQAELLTRRAERQEGGGE